MKQQECPACGKYKVHWTENNRQGCRGDDDRIYCGQYCAGRITPRAAAVEKLDLKNVLL